MLGSSVDCLALSFYVLLYYEDFLIVGIKLVYLCYDVDNVGHGLECVESVCFVVSQHLISKSTVLMGENEEMSFAAFWSVCRWYIYTTYYVVVTK